MGPSCCECFQENQSCFLQMTFHFLRWISKEQSKHILWGNFWVNVRVDSAFDDWECSIFEQIAHIHDIDKQNVLSPGQEWILRFLPNILFNGQPNFFFDMEFDIFDKPHDPWFFGDKLKFEFFSCEKSENFSWTINHEHLELH